jgi:hypothetical protein
MDVGTYLQMVLKTFKALCDLYLNVCCIESKPLVLVISCATHRFGIRSLVSFYHP